MTLSRCLARPLATWASALMLAVTPFAPAVQAAPAQKWSIVELGALGPRGSIPLAINNRGDIGGASAAIPPGTTNWYYHAFLWQNGTMTDLGAELGTPPGYVSSQVSTLNDRGTLVVNGYLGVMTWRDGQWASLGIFGAAGDINNKDAIVGSYSYGLGGRAYLYSDGMFRDLGTLGGQYSSASGINDKGQVAGTSYLAGDGVTRGFVWDNGTFTTIDTFGGLSSTAVDINSHGAVVGTAQDASGAWLAYIQDRNGMRALANVPAGAAVFAINDRGVVLGSYRNPDNQGQTQFIWDDGVVTALDQLPEVKAAGWSSIFVMDMNDRGWITGWGWQAGGSPAEGMGFLLMPK